MAKTIGYVFISLVAILGLAFAVIGIVSTITEGGFFDLYREWFNVAEKATETVTPEGESTVAAIGSFCKTIFNR